MRTQRWIQTACGSVELTVVHVKVSNEDQTSSSPCLEFCQDTPFADMKHWHNNHRTILPKHLSGKEWKGHLRLKLSASKVCYAT